MVALAPPREAARATQTGGRIVKKIVYRALVAMLRLVDALAKLADLSGAQDRRPQPRPAGPKQRQVPQREPVLEIRPAPVAETKPVPVEETVSVPEVQPVPAALVIYSEPAAEAPVQKPEEEVPLTPEENVMEIFAEFRDYLTAKKFQDARMFMEEFRTFFGYASGLQILGQLLDDGQLNRYLSDDLEFKVNRDDKPVNDITLIPKGRRALSLLWAMYERAQRPAQANGTAQPLTIEQMVDRGWTIKSDNGRQVILVKGKESLTMYRPADNTKKAKRALCR